MNLDKKQLEQTLDSDEAYKEDIKDTTRKAFERAIELTQEKGLEIGQQVYHSSEDVVYELYEINDEGVVTVGLPDGTRKLFPANELMDPKIAYSEAMKINADKKFPEKNN